MSSIVQPSAFSVSKVSVSQPKVLESGGKLAYVNYGDSRSLMIQTPSLPSPFGMSVFDKNGPPKYSLDLALRGYQDNTKVKAFYNALTSLDEFMIDLGVKNSKLWFKADMKREIVQAFYTPIVKFGRDKDGNQTPYPPNVKIQLRKNREGGFETEFYGEEAKSNPKAKALDLEENPLETFLVKKVEVTALMQCTGVWFAGGKYGLSWKAVQVRLDSVPAGALRGYGIVNDDEDAVPASSGGEFSSRPAARQVVDEDEEEETAPAPAPAQQAKAPAPALVEDDDDEEVAAAPVPKKAAPKVMTVKKVLAGPAKK
jgi:hypothetical protein